MSGEVIRLLRIRGRVQGVGYRAFAQEQATRLNLSGWARNRSDGSVEVLAAGDESMVDALIARLREGPPGARVVAIEAVDAAPEALAGRRGNFLVLSTL
jgi:acylphosphatase